MSKELKIGLFGIYGLYNFGCEAIVRGTYKLIKQAWPNCKVILFTYCAEEDKRIIEDIDVEVKLIPMNNNLFLRRLINKLLRKISISYQLPLWNSKYIADECDIIFSIGGDIYTIPKYILNNKNETPYSPIIEFGKTIIKQKKPFIIWGASIGPFGNKPEVMKYYLNHLKEVTQIFCREDITYDYLKSNNITSNIQICSDPAFYINETICNKVYPKTQNIRIALNLSLLSIREQVGEQCETFKYKIIETIIELVSIKNTEVVLVPHVISPLSEYDNDLTYLRQIYDDIPKEYKGSVNLLEDAIGFLKTKEFLRSCDVVIAARMHCAINAVCEGIPTIFLTYSQKGMGMANYIYGNSKWSIPLLNIKEELKIKTLEMIYDRKSISETIKKRIEEIQNEESKIVDLFKELI